jgi:hypothetical protein
LEVAQMAIPLPVARSSPYTYATWLSKVMAGERQCLYAGWFKSHFKVQGKQDANLDAWTAEHTAMVHDCAADFRSRGFKAYIESQNSLRIRGQRGAVLAGKPDIVAVKGDTAIVIDCKTGSPKASDSLQVRLYMYLLGEWSTHPARACSRVLGEIRYKREEDETVYLPHAAADGIAALMRQYMKVFLDAAPPLPVPSYQECGFCELGRLFCPDRIETDVEMVESNLF